MNHEKYIGLDVHQATISVAVMDRTGKIIMECIVETKAATILEFFAGLRGTLAVTFEEGTSAACCTICCDHMWPKWWSAIRAKTLCSSNRYGKTKSTYVVTGTAQALAFLQGLEAEELFSTFSRGISIFLDIPLYRTGRFTPSKVVP